MNPTVRTRRPWAAAAAALAATLAGLLVLGACSSGAGDDAGSAVSADSPGSSAAGTDTAERAAGTPAPDAEAAGGATGGTDSIEVELDDGVFTGRDLIRTASMTVVSRDVEAVRLEVADLVDRVGGAIASETSSAQPTPGGEEELRTIRLGLQVPTDRLDATVAALSELGSVRQRSVATQDVTTEVADVDSRVQSARSTLRRIRALMSRANSLGTVIRLEGQLSRRQAALESLLAQQRSLSEQTALATVDLELVTATDRVQPDETEARGFLAGLDKGWDGLSAFLLAVSTATGLLLPFAAVAGLLAVPLLLRHRRRDGRLSPPLA